MDVVPDRRPILLCLSHLPWDLVFQRPHHLMSRAVAAYRVVFFEESLAATGGAASLHTRISPEGVLVAAPMLPSSLDEDAANDAKRALLDGLLDDVGAPEVVWFYTPMGLAFAGHLRAPRTVFDSMDELSAFRGAPSGLLALEARLLERADIVFTGGRSLHEAKRHRHPHVFLEPSSIDARHFARARPGLPDPADQASLPRPRLGYAGVIDERLDLGLVATLAARRPDWSIVMIGPVQKIDVSALPRAPNLHWLGLKPYSSLPDYMAGWDVALMPFALNEATRYISPTKTPEYLAAGLPVISTSIADVVHDWGDVVELAADAGGFVAAAARAMARPRAPWLARVDERLSGKSWDATWARMAARVAVRTPAHA